ncbi:MAG: hypothetical protein ACFFEF_10140 [Candidatus Thorarchaeota archaeon]
MTSRKEELGQIHSIVSANPKNTNRETRIRFWSLVRDIKREHTHNDEEILLAASIRDLLFDASRGRTFSLRPTLALQFSLGILLAVIPYLYSLTLHLDWGLIFIWSLSDWGIFSLRFLTVFLGVAVFYPIGRLIGARYTGIKLTGVCRDQYYEPTLRIDYVSFLQATPAKRKWFFFIAGIWTIITSLIFWIVGFAIAGDFTGLIPAIPLFFLEGYVIFSGKSSHTGGEMGHYNREKKIERVWKEKGKEKGI